VSSETVDTIDRPKKNFNDPLKTSPSPEPAAEDLLKRMRLACTPIRRKIGREQMAQENVHAVAHLHAHPDKTEELNSLLKSLLEPTRKEPGCIQFTLLQNRDTPAEFAIVSEWLNEQAVQEHVRTATPSEL
jgi:quinol monooxygenase YgiN